MLGVDEFVFVDLRFRLVLGARGVSAARKPSKMNCSLVQKLHCTMYTLKDCSKFTQRSDGES